MNRFGRFSLALLFLISFLAIFSGTVSANYCDGNQVKSDNTYCSSYESYCSGGYSNECTGGYSNECTGGYSCSSYSCDSYSNTCDGYSNTCDGYSTVCPYYTDVCTGYSQDSCFINEYYWYTEYSISKCNECKSDPSCNYGSGSYSCSSYRTKCANPPGYETKCTGGYSTECTGGYSYECTGGYSCSSYSCDGYSNTCDGYSNTCDGYSNRCDGYSTSTSTVETCETDRTYPDWSSHYCNSNDNVEEKRDYIDYQGCSSGSCTSTSKTEYNTVETCPDGCNSGTCVDAPKIGLNDNVGSGTGGSQISESAGTVSSGETVSKNFNSVDGVSSVDVDVSGSGSGVSIAVQDLGVSRPATVPAPKGLVLGYRQVSVSGLSNSDISNAELEFDLDESKFSGIAADPEDVSVKRYSFGDWNDLTSSVRGVGTGNIDVSAVTPGFSTFALTVEGLRPSGTGKATEPVLEADVKHEENRDVTARFYNDVTGNKIGEETVSGSSGDISTASVVWDGDNAAIAADDPGTVYEFRVELDDGVNTVSDTQSFRIQKRPGVPFDPYPPSGSGGFGLE